MTSEQSFVWAWLPGSPEPIVCGRVWVDGDQHLFQYGRSYLGNRRAIPLFGMPLDDRPLAPAPDIRLHGALQDALPDAWGQQVIATRSGLQEPSAIQLMRLSSTDRFGAIDFQDSPDAWLPRQTAAMLEDLAHAAEAVEKGTPLSPALDAALQHGTSIGGARPKATLIDAQGRDWIAKFSSTSDGARPVVRREAFALELAARGGVDVVGFQLSEAAGRDALLVKRFDREHGGARRMAVSALTVLGVSEYAARYSSYPELLDRLRDLSEHPDGVGPTLFRRIAANIALGNTDDHAHNHAAFWDGSYLTLTPAYDIDPCRTPGWDANQAMAYGRRGERASNLQQLIQQASVYDLSKSEARDVVDQVVGAVSEHWESARDAARLSRHQAEQMRGTQILNEGALDGLPATTLVEKLS
ncbi:MAG TPA: type II toxin-antitoxin system HipA family toxin [Arachnia sp.]|nr:type II toxin-antitoxin system HipA family toxin [Arachnia sp.]HMT85124.1 type II toxin-antitoxin system HipA family toxin [Arachnia sp.]